MNKYGRIIKVEDLGERLRHIIAYASDEVSIQEFIDIEGNSVFSFNLYDNIVQHALKSIINVDIDWLLAINKSIPIYNTHDLHYPNWDIVTQRAEVGYESARIYFKKNKNYIIRDIKPHKIDFSDIDNKCLFIGNENFSDFESNCSDVMNDIESIENIFFYNDYGIPMVKLITSLPEYLPSCILQFLESLLNISRQASMPNNKRKFYFFITEI